MKVIINRQLELSCSTLDVYIVKENGLYWIVGTNKLLPHEWWADMLECKKDYTDLERALVDFQSDVTILNLCYEYEKNND